MNVSLCVCLCMCCVCVCVNACESTFTCPNICVCVRKCVLAHGCVRRYLYVPGSEFAKLVSAPETNFRIKKNEQNPRQENANSDA